MEVVQTFNKEMKSLLDHRPPVSRQKMSMITKSAIRGIKFYKHIVQSVEKFIQKCSPDYKVPGLYVMDAIIRQSRHQYGAERDVFAPRFLKNLLPTFQQLFRCDEKDQHLVVRVLNLWLKNETFPPEVIQALLSLADNPDDPNLVALAQAQVSVAITNQTTGGASLHRLKRPHHHHQQRHRQRQSSQQQDFVDNEADEQTDVAMETMPGDDNDVDYIGDNSSDAGLTMTDSAAATAAAAAAAAMPQGGIISSVAELLQKFQDTDDVRDQINQLQSLQDKILQQSSLLSQQQMIDPDILGQLQALMEELTKTARAAVEREQEAQRAKDVVAFDYGDESDDEANIGSNGLQKRQPVGIPMPSTAAGGGGGGGGVDQNFLDQLQQMTETLAQTRVLQEQLQSARMRQQLEEAEQQQQQQLHHLQEGQYYQIQQHQLLQQQQQQQQQQHHRVSYEEGEIDDETKATGSASKPGISYNNNNNTAVGESGGDQYSRGGKRDTGHGHGHGHGHSSRHPRSPTSAAAAAATASQSTSSSSRRRRRSHSGGRGESSERRRKERKRKALPRLRDGRLSIVSATIFIGKLQKSTTEGRLRSLLDEYGQVQALVLIPSRGCGFVVYSKRKHAAKAIDKLRSTRLEGATLRVAWAPNKGIKDTEMKEFWDEEEGCTYIPYDRFPRDESWRDLLQGGAFIDQDSVPLELVDLVRQTTPRDQDVGDVDQRVRDPAAHAEAVAGMPPPQAVSGGASSVALNLPPPPPPPPQLAHHMLMMQPPPMPMQMPHFPAFMPPPPPPPPSSSTNAASTSSPPAPGDSPAAAVSLGSKPHPRTTLLPMPPPQQPHQHQQQHVRTPIPPHRPPHVGFFRGGGIGSGILPPPPFNPRGGGGGIGAWRGGGGIGRGL